MVNPQLVVQQFAHSRIKSNALLLRGAQKPTAENVRWTPVQQPPLGPLPRFTEHNPARSFTAEKGKLFCVVFLSKLLRRVADEPSSSTSVRVWSSRRPKRATAYVNRGGAAWGRGLTLTPVPETEVLTTYPDRTTRSWRLTTCRLKHYSKSNLELLTSLLTHVYVQSR